MFRKLQLMLQQLISHSMWHQPHYGEGQGEWGSRGSDDNEYNTGVGYEKQIFNEVLTKTFVGSLSKRNKSVNQLEALGLDGGIDKSTFIWKRTITEGDEYRLTHEDAIVGNGTYGDKPVAAGPALGYKNQNFRINQTKSPAAQVPGIMQQQRVAKSLTGLSEATRQAAITWMAEEVEFDAIISYLYGASKSLLKSRADGGLAVNLGPESGIGAGTPLFGMHMYTTDTGFITYDGSALSTHNSLVNDAINGIDAAAADKLTLSQHEKIRTKLDQEKFLPGTINGQEIKALALTDPDICTRLGKNILRTDYGTSGPRENDYKNRIFRVDYTILLDGILYIPVENLRKFRPAYNATNGYPDIGPGLTQDPREYTNSETIGWVIYCGAGSLLWGTNGMVEVSEGRPKHKKDGQEWSAWQKFGIKRNQWDTYDGRSESTCNSVLLAAFYEPGHDW